MPPRSSPEPSADSANRPSSRSRSALTNRAAASGPVSWSRQAYSRPAPAGPLTAGRMPLLAPAPASASSTPASWPTQNVTLTTVCGAPASGTASHHRNDPSARAVVGCAPADSSRSDIRLARSATPDGVPSSRTPTRSISGTPVHSSSTADGTSADPAAEATAAAAAARLDGPLGAKSPVTQATAAGSGCSRNVTSVIRPSVPCEPENSLPRS